MSLFVGRDGIPSYSWMHIDGVIPSEVEGSPSSSVMHEIPRQARDDNDGLIAQSRRWLSAHETMRQRP